MSPSLGRGSQQAFPLPPPFSRHPHLPSLDMRLRKEAPRDPVMKEGLPPRRTRGPQGFPATDGPPTFFDFHSYRGVRDGTRSSALAFEFPGILPHRSEKKTSLRTVRCQRRATDRPPVNGRLVPLPSQKACPRTASPLGLLVSGKRWTHSRLVSPLLLPCSGTFFPAVPQLSTLRVSAWVPPCQSCFLQTVPRAQGALSLLLPPPLLTPWWSGGCSRTGLPALKATHSSWELGRAVSVSSLCASARSHL